jgi:hypothetical protein
MTRKAGLTVALAGVDRDYIGGEAARAVARCARDRADEQLLLDVLGLEATSSVWDTARVAYVTIERCRGGGQFSANTLTLWVPQRARPLIARALTWLGEEGLVVKTGRTVLSAAPGARRRRIPCWQLTLDGERLSRELSPPPGMIPAVTELNRVKAV